MSLSRNVLVTLCILGVFTSARVNAALDVIADSESLGVSSTRLERIDGLMNDYVERGVFPGMIVTVARRGQVVYHRTFGYQDIAERKPLQDDAIFRIYSMTKPVTGVAVMMLFEQGRFLLDDPVAKYLPALADVQVYVSGTGDNLETAAVQRPITVRDLLRQTGGLGYGWGTDPVSQRYQKANLFDPNTTLEQMVEKLGTLPLYFQPGSDWQYSVSIDVLGRLVEVWSGQPLDEFFQEHIFGPLEMKDTGFYVPSEKRDRFTAVYNYSAADGLVPLSRAEAYDHYTRGRKRMLSGGGGLVSTVEDYLRFVNMLANGGSLGAVRILSPKTVKLMSTDALPDGVTLPWFKLKGHGYGFTMSVQTDNAQSPTLGSVGDFGWDGAASTYFRIDPQEDLVILLMTHRMPCDDEIQIKLKTLVYQALQ